jgi:hypothetical protein
VRCDFRRSAWSGDLGRGLRRRRVEPRGECERHDAPARGAVSHQVAQSDAIPSHQRMQSAPHQLGPRLRRRHRQPHPAPRRTAPPHRHRSKPRSRRRESNPRIQLGKLFPGPNGRSYKPLVDGFTANSNANGNWCSCSGWRTPAVRCRYGSGSVALGYGRGTGAPKSNACCDGVRCVAGHLAGELRIFRTCRCPPRRFCPRYRPNQPEPHRKPNFWRRTVDRTYDAVATYVQTHSSDAFVDTLQNSI